MSRILLDAAELLVDGDWVESKDQDPTGEVRLIQLADIAAGRFLNKSKRFLTKEKADLLRCTYLSPGDVLIARMPDPIGRACVFPNLNRPCVTAVDIAILRPKAGVDSEYVACWINQPAFLAKVAQEAKGATRQRISRRNLEQFPLRLPSEIEQRRIVTRIKECMERVEEIEINATKVTRELNALFPALLNERFTKIREVYGVRLFEDVVDIRGGGSLPKGSANDCGGASALLVKVGDMNTDGNERTIFTAREFLPLSEAGRGSIEAGAVIFPKRGGAIATNKKRLLGRPALIDPNLMAVVAKPEVMSPDYLYYWCQALDLSKLSNGGVIPQLNRKDLAKLEIPVPDIKAQSQIVEELQRAEEYCAQLKVEFTDTQAERVRLREAVLHKAFAEGL